MGTKDTGQGETGDTDMGIVHGGTAHGLEAKNIIPFREAWAWRMARAALHKPGGHANEAWGFKKTWGMREEQKH